METANRLLRTMSNRSVRTRMVLGDRSVRTRVVLGDRSVHTRVVLGEVIAAGERTGGAYQATRRSSRKGTPWAVA